MGQNVDLIGIACKKQPKCVLEVVAGRCRAIGIIDISPDFSARSPGKQHGDRHGFRIVNDLCKTIEPLREHRVEAVNEQEHLAAATRTPRQLSIQGSDEFLFTFKIRRLAYNKIRFWISGRIRWPFDFASGVVLWNRDRHYRIVERLPSLAVV